MRILVTGGLGFIGSHLVESLAQQYDNDHIIIFDNLSTGRIANIDPALINSGQVVVFIGDISVYESVNKFRKSLKGKIDQIYNLACPASPKAYQLDPIQTWKTSVFGVSNMLDLALDNSATFLQASTSEVYGDPLEHPQNESYYGNVNPCGVRSCYDEGKRAAESLITDYKREKGLSIRIARIFNTYGLKMQINDGRVVSNFIVQALENEPITVYGSGTQTRSLCYVDDMVSGLIALMKINIEDPVNLGRDIEIEITNLANIIIRLTKSSSEIEKHGLPKDDPCRRKPNISKATGQLDWYPKIDMTTGLIKTIKYFKNELKYNV